MIEIALHRSLSWVIASFGVRPWGQGDTSRRLRDKSADVRRAHVVGRVEVSSCRVMSAAGASHGNVNEIKSAAAVAHLDPVSKPS